MARSTTTSSYQTYAGNPAENYERYFVPFIGRPSARLLLQAARLEEGERVLDVACGTGVATRLAAEAVGATGSVVGVDIHPGMLAVARTATPEGTAIEWHQAAAEKLPLPDASFDAVLCSLGLQFFTDKVQSLREMRRVLTAGGRAILGAPGPTPPLFHAIDEALRDRVGPEASAFVHAVFSVHDPDAVRAQLDAAGFRETRVESHTLALRLPPPADFLWQYMTSTPLAATAAELDDATRAALEQDVVQRCQRFMDGDALLMEVGVLLATARREA